MVRVGNVKPLVTSMSFECNKCKDVQTVGKLTNQRKMYTLNPKQTKMCTLTGRFSARAGVKGGEGGQNIHSHRVNFHLEPSRQIASYTSLYVC